MNALKFVYRNLEEIAAAAVFLFIIVGMSLDIGSQRLAYVVTVELVANAAVVVAMLLLLGFFIGRKWGQK